MAAITQEMPRLRPDIIKTIIELTPAGYCVVDRDMRVRYANESFCRLAGVSPGEAAGNLCYDVVHRGEPCPSCPVQKVMATGRPQRTRISKDIRADGETHYLDKTVLPILDGDGRLECTLSVFRDRTRQVRLQKQSQAVYFDLVRSLVGILEKKDPYTSEHSANVGAIAGRLARYMGLPDDQVYRVHLGGLLHDIGKVTVADGVIHKNSKLSDGEYEAIKRHPRESFRLLAGLQGEGVDEVRGICLHHHERWDGQGYPDGLAGGEIPLAAQIVALADSYDAMTTDRPYRRALSHETALEAIKQGLGTQFGPGPGIRFLEMATLHFKSRESMAARDVLALDSYMRYLAGDGAGVPEKYVGPKEALAREWDDGSPSCMRFTLGDDLARRVFAATSAYYAVLDKHQTVRYVSEAMLAELGRQAGDYVGRQCYDVAEKAGGCLMEGDGLMCPGLRALHDGTVEHCVADEVWAGQPRSFDLCAMPMDVDGERHILEIMFDRTEEALARRDFMRNGRAVIDTLQGLIARVNPAETAGSEAIINECRTVGDYFSRYEEWE